MGFFNNVVNSFDKKISPNNEYNKIIQSKNISNKSSISNIIDSFDNFVSPKYNLKVFPEKASFKNSTNLENKQELNKKDLIESNYNSDVNIKEEKEKTNKGECLDDRNNKVLKKEKKPLENLNVSSIMGTAHELAYKQKEKVLDIKNKSLNQVFNEVSEKKETITKKVEKYVKDLKIISPVMNKLGYAISEIEIELAIVPKVIPHFHRHTMVKIEIQEKILAYCKEHGIPTLILSALVEASKIQNNMNLGSFKFTDIIIELGLIPSVKIKFIPEKEKGGK